MIPSKKKCVVLSFVLIFSLFALASFGVSAGPASPEKGYSVVTFYVA